MESPTVRTCWYTDRGRRPSNEDAVLVEALIGDRDLVAVADGMGGHAGGEIASGKALQTLLNRLESSNDLAAAVKDANAALLAAAEENPEWRGMGTTLVALLRVGATYHVANVGDSRAYRLDESGISRITEDHSFTAEAVSSGRLSEDEAERSPWRNALTRAVGTDAEVEVDVFGPFELTPAHVVLLCTDGLYRVMSDSELDEEVRSRQDRLDSARDLVADALRRGSNDNISVALVEFGDMNGGSATDTPELDRTGPGLEVGPPNEAALVPVAAAATEPAPTPEAEPAPRTDPAPAEQPPPAAPETAPDSSRAAPAYRGARRAASRVSRPKGRKDSSRRRAWIKRELVPALLLIGATIAVVYVLNGVF